MDDLEQRSREQLLALVRLQAERIAQLEHAVQDLEQDVQALRDLLRRGSDNGLPPFVKPNRKKREPGQPKKTRKKRSENHARKREDPTKEIPHVVEHCPDCGRKLTGGWEHSRHQVIEIPQLPVEIVDHVLFRRRCGVCGTHHLPKLGPEDGVFGQKRVGPRLMAFIATLCTQFRLPRKGVQELLESLYGVHLSVGAITEILHAVGKHGKDVVATILQEVREAPFVHGDETGFRENGINGYLWSFSTPTARYFHRDPSRAAHVAKGILLGERLQEDGTIRQEECDPFVGALICDFYSAYSWYDGPLQRCWDHLCRALKEVKAKHGEDETVVAWVGSVFKVYQRAKEAAAGTHPEGKRRRMKRAFEEELHALARPYLQEETAPQHALAARIERFLSELFVFVQYPGMPSGNNAAERALRPTVIMRKISGGTRSPQGSATLSALRTLFGTWKLKELDALQASFELLVSTPIAAPAAPT